MTTIQNTILSAAQTMKISAGLQGGHKGPLTATPNLVQVALLQNPTLTPCEREVLEYRFGINGKVPQTLEQTGEKIGVKHSFLVQSIQSRALRKLHLSPPTKSQWRSRTFVDG